METPFVCPSLRTCCEKENFKNQREVLTFENCFFLLLLVKLVILDCFVTSWGQSMEEICPVSFFWIAAGCRTNKASCVVSVQVLHEMKPWKTLHQLFLTLLALPSSLQRTQVFDKVSNRSFPQVWFINYIRFRLNQIGSVMHVIMTKTLFICKNLGWVTRKLALIIS